MWVNDNSSKTRIHSIDWHHLIKPNTSCLVTKNDVLSQEKIEISLEFHYQEKAIWKKIQLRLNHRFKVLLRQFWELGPNLLEPRPIRPMNSQPCWLLHTFCNLRIPLKLDSSILKLRSVLKLYGKIQISRQMSQIQIWIKR